MTERIGRLAHEPPSIWLRPTQAGLAVALLFGALAVIGMPPGLEGGVAIGLLLGELVEGFVAGFLAAAVLLTYARVVDRSD